MSSRNIKHSIRPKYVLTDELKKIYERIDPPRALRGSSKYEELLFAVPSILYILSEVLEIASPPENMYKIEYLRKRYELYRQKFEKLSFAFEDLFTSGWLMRRVDEWQFVGNRYTIKILDTSSQSIDAQIVDFVKSLNDVSFSDGMLLRIDIKSAEFKAILDISHKSLEWFLEQKILLSEDDCYYVSGQGEIWREFGDQTLSYKLKQWLKEDGPESYSRWFIVCAGMPACYRPERFLDDVEGIYKRCLAYLKSEADIVNWDDISKVLEKNWRIRIQDVDTSCDIKIPDNQRLRYNMLGQQHYESLCELSSTKSTSSRFFDFCSRNYNHVSMDLQKEFQLLLRRPIYRIYYFYVGVGENFCMIDCLSDVELFYETARSLETNLFHGLLYKTVGATELAAFGKNVWNQLFNGVWSSVDLADKSSWIQNLIDWALFLCCKSERFHHHLMGNYQRRTCFNTLFSDLIDSYAADISPEMDNVIIFRILELLKEEADIDYTGYMGLLLCFADRHREVVSAQGKEIYSLVYEGFAVWSQRAQDKDILLSTVSWTMFDHHIWRAVFAANLDKAKDFFDVLAYIKYDFLPDDNVSHLLIEGKLAGIYLYLATIWLRDLRADIDSKSIKSYETIWVKKFFEFQGGMRIFSGENIRLLGADGVVQCCMKFLSIFSDEARGSFTNKLKIKSADYKQDIIFWISYIENKRIKKACIEILRGLSEEGFFKGLYFIPTMRIMMERVFEISFEVRNNQKSLKQLPDDDLYPVLMEVLNKAIESFENVINQKGKPMQEEYKSWLQSAKSRKLILENNTDSILEGTDDFYKGLVYLEKDSIDDLRKAVDIFSSYYKQEEWSLSINYLISLAKLICKLNQSADEYDNELERFRHVFNILKIHCDEGSQDQISLYYHYLLLCQELDLPECFWEIYQEMSEFNKTDSNCARIIIPMMIREKRLSLATRLLDRLQARYGETDELKQMCAAVEAGNIQEIQRRANMTDPSLNLKISSEPDINTMKNMLRNIPALCNDDLAELFSNVMVPSDAYNNFKTDNMQGVTVVHILNMLFPILNKLGEYSLNVLRCYDNILKEDMYNKSVMYFFNMHVPFHVGYSMRDQSQGGVSEKDVENGTGSRDLIISRKNKDIMLLEGIRLNYIDRSIIKRHIKKLRNYNDAEYHLMAILIYCYAVNTKEFWEKYMDYLDELKENNECEIETVEREVELEALKIDDKPRFICKTKHYYNGSARDVYHIMIAITHKNSWGQA